MDPISAAIALKALDGLYLRSTVTAQNIANANTASYRPLRVSFEKALEAAAPKGLEAIEAVQPKIETDHSESASDGLRLDLELGNAAGAAGRYSALIEVLDRQLQLVSLATTGNS
jgi:flagellar basal-body rod protein FlgB